MVVRQGAGGSAVIRGGQGRSPRHVRDASESLAFTFLAILAMVVALVARGCAG